MYKETKALTDQSMAEKGSTSATVKQPWILEVFFHLTL